jgi:hypothetical protein
MRIEAPRLCLGALFFFVPSLNLVREQVGFEPDAAFVTSNSKKQVKILGYKIKNALTLEVYC